MAEPPTANLLGIEQPSVRHHGPPSCPAPPAPARPAPPVPKGAVRAPPPSAKALPERPEPATANRSVPMREKSKPTVKPAGARGRPIIQVVDARPMSEVGFRGIEAAAKPSSEPPTGKHAAPQRPRSFPDGVDSNEIQVKQSPKESEAHTEPTPAPRRSPPHGSEPPVPMRRETVKKSSPSAPPPRPVSGPPLSPTRPPPPKRSQPAGKSSPPPSPEPPPSNPASRAAKVGVLIPGLAGPRVSSLPDNAAEGNDEQERQPPVPSSRVDRKAAGGPPSPRPRPKPRPGSMMAATSVPEKPKPARPHSVMVPPTRPHRSPTSEGTDRAGAAEVSTVSEEPVNSDSTADGGTEGQAIGSTNAGDVMRRKGPTIIRPASTIKTATSDHTKPGTGALEDHKPPVGKPEVKHRDNAVHAQAAPSQNPEPLTRAPIENLHKESSPEGHSDASSSSHSPPQVKPKPKVAKKPAVAAKPKVSTKPVGDLPSDQAAATKGPAEEKALPAKEAASGGATLPETGPKSKEAKAETAQSKPQADDKKEEERVESADMYDEKPLPAKPRKPTIIGFPRHSKRDAGASGSSSGNHAEPTDTTTEPSASGSSAPPTQQSNDTDYNEKPLPPKPEKKRPTIIGRPKSKLVEERTSAGEDALHKHKPDVTAAGTAAAGDAVGNGAAGPAAAAGDGEDTNARDTSHYPNAAAGGSGSGQKDESEDLTCMHDNEANMALAAIVQGSKKPGSETHAEQSSVPTETSSQVSSPPEKKAPPGRPPPVKAAAPGRPAAPPPASPPGRSTGPSPASPPGGPTRPPPAQSQLAPRQSGSQAPKPGSPPAKPPRVAAKASKKGPPPSLPTRPGPGHPLFHYTVSGPHGIAMYDYTASQSDELSFKAGDVIELEDRVDEDWLYGRNVNKSGMFPASFIDIIEPPSDKALPGHVHHKHVTEESRATQQQGSGPRCIARFDFEGETANDLSFTEGQVIQLVARVGEEWLEGQLNGRTGIFPLAYVEIVEDLPRDTAHSKDHMVKALFDYKGEGDDLSFEAGDMIHVVSRVDMQWLVGEIHGRSGTFPATFIDHIPENLPQKEPATNQEAKVTDGGTSNEPTQQAPTATYCTARYKFEGEHANELSFDVGDRISVISKLDADWWKGSLNGKEGIFPCSFVAMEDEKASQDAGEVKPQETHHKDAKVTTACTTAKALYEFPGESEGDLAFKVGDIITNIEEIDSEWLRGKVGDNTGIFPRAFVKVQS